MTAGMRWVYAFDDIPDGDARQILGGKGASLAEMTRAGLRVPPGFTISTECCRHFFANGGTWPEGLEAQIREHLARLEQAMGRTYGRGKPPLLVSVRSGAAVSMPGMMDTLLNCGLHPGLADDLGDTPHLWSPYLQFISSFAKIVDGIGPEAFLPEPPSRAAAERRLRIYEEKAGRPLPRDPWALLVACVNAVFRSWDSERAVAYRKHNDVRGLDGTAVSVQAMFPSRVSGILFTQNPANLSAGQIVVESSWGLGESVVSGEVTPDRFIVRREGLQLAESVLGNKAHRVAALGDENPVDPGASSLDSAQVDEICRLGLKIESHFGKPMDIEWGLADGKVALLQCRPIRGIEVAEDVEAGRREEIERLRGLAAGKRHVWVTHNLGETLRTPTPMTWDIVSRFMSGSGGFGLLYRDLGYSPSEEVSRRGFLELVCGRVYADPDRVAQLFWDGVPMEYDLEALLQNKGLLDRAPSRFEPERVDGGFILRLPGLVAAMIRSSKLMKRARLEAKMRFDERILPPYLEYVRAKRAQDLRALTSAQVIAELDDRCRRVLNEFGKESLKPGFFGGIAFDAAAEILIRLGGRAEGASLASTLTAGLEGDVTFEQDALLYRVVRDEARMEDFLERFGHRASDEMELAQPRWREDADYLKRLRTGAARPPDEIHGENAKRRAAAEKALPETLARWGGGSFREEIEQNLREARSLLPYREGGKHYLMMGYELIRGALLELSRRWGLGGDVFFLRLEELPAFEGRRAALAEEIARRKTRWKAFQRLELPDVIDSEKLDGLGLPQELEAATELQGDAVAPGVATGPAQIVFDPRSAALTTSGYVLVCPSTDPGWTPLFMNAKALVVERGGILSHGAIVARDFGIPAVVCRNATTLIHAGDTVRVDGGAGKVSVLERKA